VHIFLECNLAGILWRFSPWSFSISDFFYRPIASWILAIIFPVAILGIPKVDVKKFHLYASLMLDSIWRCRNSLIHDGVQPSPSKVFYELSCTFNFHLKAWKDLALPSLWAAPVASWIKGNFDVAIRGSFAVVAAVLSDDMGDIVAAATQRLTCTEALQGEALAALLTSRLAASFGCNLFFLWFQPSTIPLFFLLGILQIVFHTLM
jgi:hypothetical protein